MKVLILAGGFGTRISEESHLRPKPMIEIGEMPILWHIMKYYSSYGYNDFIILAGYKQYVIKEYFANYFLHNSDVTFDLSNNQMEVHHNMNGGRIKRVQDYVGDEPFMLTYGDGVSNVDLDALVNFHHAHGKIATITTVSLAQQKGVLDIDENNQIRAFREKEREDGAIINGGFMVFQPEVFNYLTDDRCVLEQEPMHRLAADGELMSFYHAGFWQCMDTQREKKLLEDLWASGKAPWKLWE